MDLGLLQREVAKKLGVCTHSVRNWEAGRSSPEIERWPAILDFLGYDPHPEPENLAELLKAIRRRRGLTRKALAHLIGVCDETVTGWEEQAHRPTGLAREQLGQFLEGEAS